MSHGPRRPHPQPLDYITATQLAEGVDCLWRLGFSRDPIVSSLSRPSAEGALGSAAHEVMSKMGMPVDFESVWQQAVSHAQAALIRGWAPASPPENWPGWALTKVRMRKAWEHSAGRPVYPASSLTHGFPDGGGRPPLPWKERWLRHPHLGLAGRPDLVERVGGELWVVDLKTGLKQNEPTPVQRTQLLFYCALVEAALGQLPAYAAVQTTRGDCHSFRVDAGEVQDVIVAASSMLDRINEPGPEGLAVTMASPSAKACGWCPFRPACGPFFDAYEETWQIPHALVFGVQAVDQSPHGYIVRATVTRPRWRANEEVHVVGFPFERAPAVGDLWGAINFAGRASSAVAGWSTTVFQWG